MNAETIGQDGSAEISADITLSEENRFNPPKKHLAEKLRLLNRRMLGLVYTPAIKKKAAPFIPEILDELHVGGYLMKRGKGVYLVSPAKQIRVALDTGNWWHIQGDGSYFTIIALWQRYKGIPDGTEGYEEAALQLSEFIDKLKAGLAEEIRLKMAQKERRESFATKDAIFELLFKGEAGIPLYKDAPRYTQLLNERMGVLGTENEVTTEGCFRQFKTWAQSGCQHRFSVEMKKLAQRRYKFLLTPTGRDIRAELLEQYHAVMARAPIGKYDEWAKGWVAWKYR